MLHGNRKSRVNPIDNQIERQVKTDYQDGPLGSMIDGQDDIFGDNEANSLIVKDKENNNIFTDSIEMVNGLSRKIKNATNQNLYK